MSDQTTPEGAWQALVEGNARFVGSRFDHPNQDADRRAALEEGQTPFALIFGCSDSRVAAEIIFDRGLGDLFVVRTAGQVVDSAVLGSLEYGVGVLGIPLVIVLGHDSCGAVKAAIDATDAAQMPGGFVRDLVERVTPSVLAARRAGLTEVNEIVGEHARQTASLLPERSTVLASAVADGRVAILPVGYALHDGHARLLIDNPFTDDVETPGSIPAPPR